jgi:hypothetical protein
MSKQRIYNRLENLLNEGFSFNRNYYFQSAFELIRPNILLLAIFTALYMGIAILMLQNPKFGPWIQMLINGPISAGYYLVMHRIFQKQPLSFENFFEGFKIFLPVLMVSIVVNLITTIGFVLLIIPGLAFALLFLFSMPLVVFGNLDYFSAMEVSRKIVMRNFGEFVILGLVITLINVIGLLMFAIGVLVTIPLSYAIIFLVYKDLIGLEDSENNEKDFSYFR